MALGCYFKKTNNRIIKCNSGSVNKAMTMLTIVFCQTALCHVMYSNWKCSIEVLLYIVVYDV